MLLFVTTSCERFTFGEIKSDSHRISMIRNSTFSLHFCVENPFCDVHVRGLLHEMKEKGF